MRLLTVLFFIVFLVINAQSQIHYPDERWPVGINEFSDAEGYGNSWIHFESDTILLEDANLNLDFESTVAVASDEDGNILFYSNGCEINNAEGNVMDNGENINPGLLHDWVCSSGYTVPRGMMAIPLPENSAKWIVLHTGGNYDPVRKLTYGPFYYTEIDMEANTGLGAVTSKNNLLSEEELEPFAVVRHGNGRDWWVIIPEYNTNKYHIWLLNPGGISLKEIQIIGDSIGCRRIGSSGFSLDGSKYSRVNNCEGIVLDFDRCSGHFSNSIYLERPAYTLGGGGGVFSTDNRWLYVTSDRCIFRADLNSPTPFLDSLFKQPYYVDISEYVFGTSLAYMQYAPDGNIYINSQHRERHLSSLTILNDSFTYQPKALELPVLNTRTLPHFPNFRLFDWADQICDTLDINGPPSSSSENVKNNAEFTIYPNPVTGNYIFIKLQSLNLDNSIISIYDVLGHLVNSSTANCVALPNCNILIESLPPGVYFLTVQNDLGMWTKKFVRQ